MIDLVTVANHLCQLHETSSMTATDLVSLNANSWLVSDLNRLTDANQKRLDAYRQKLGGEENHFAFDLSQNAEHRCRAAPKTHMSTLTKNCGLWYMPTLERFLCVWVALCSY